MTQNAMTITDNMTVRKPTAHDRFEYLLKSCVEGTILMATVGAVIFGAALLVESGFKNDMVMGVEAIALAFTGGVAGLTSLALYGMKLFDENNPCKYCTAAFTAAACALGLWATTHTNTALAMGSVGMQDDVHIVEAKIHAGIEADKRALRSTASALKNVILYKLTGS